jgi:uncharacterized protein (DUF1330 family)
LRSLATAAYLIVNIAVKDPAGFEEYKARVPALIRKHGGEYLVVGGKLIIAEGDWKPTAIVILRFPDMASAQGFYDDPEYQPLKELRQRVSDGDIVIVDGL